jgi:hypothetical protein
MIIPNPRQARTPEPIKLSKVLYVEGPTPMHFFDFFVRGLGLDDSIEIRSFGGINELALRLKTLAAGNDFRTHVRSLGIVRDAESDAAAALRSAQDAVTRASIGRNVSVSYFILPDNSRPGMIETLCMASVMPKPVFQCIQQFITGVRGVGVQLPTGIGLAKHELQVYLATLDNPQMMPGLASHKGAWSFDDIVFKDIKDFLRRL